MTRNRDLITFQKGQQGLSLVTEIVKQDKYWIQTTTDKRLDLMSGGSAFILGYCNNEINDAIYEMLQRVNRAQSHLGFVTEETKLAGNILCDTGNWDSLIWSITGTGAVELSLAIAEAFWQGKGFEKEYVVTFPKCWHGTSSLTKAMSGFSSSIANTVFHIDTPNWRKIEDRHDAELKTLASLEKLLKEKHSVIGSIVFDPCPWFDGTKPFSNVWWVRVRELCDEYNVLMITDDVAGCWGKSKHYHSHQEFNVKPDITTVGKAITSGHAPLSAALMSSKVASQLKRNGEIFYGHTVQPYMGGIAAMLKTYEIIERDGLMTKAITNEDKLTKLAQKYVDAGKIDTFRAHGCFLGLDIPDTVITDLFKFGLSGRVNDINSIKICAPLIADDEYFTELEQRLDDYLK